MFMAALGVADVKAQSAGLVGEKWKLTAIGERELSDSKAYLEIAEDKARVSGNAGCNRFFGGVTISRNALKFSGIGSTRMMCQDSINDETEFFEALRKVTRFRIREGKLTMFAGRQAVLTFAHDGKGAETNSAVSLESKKWVLESVKGNSVGKLETEAFIRFNGNEKSVGGNTSCNVFGGNATWGDGKFEFSQGISTLRACIEDNRMEIERGVLDGLNNADRYEVKGEKLHLYKGTELLLTFVGKDE